MTLMSRKFTRDMCSVRGIGVENIARFVFIKHAETGALAGFARLLFIVVIHLARGYFGFAGADMVIVIKITAEGGNPFELPAHAFLKCLKFLPGRARYREQGNIVMGKVQVGPIKMIG